MSVHAIAESICEQGELVGEAPPFVACKERIAKIAKALRTTTIVGPTGSGKELVARQLHRSSPRAGRPYVTVHCAALPDNLVEAELFGHCRGAFTGATQDRPGLIRTASQGTLFLDEIDSLTLPAQAKLLRFLETGEYRAVGSDRLEHSDAWVIAATNRDLRESVREGSFRADLVYRLEVIRLDVPGLSSRGDDVLLLSEYFLKQIDPTRTFAPSAYAAIRAHPWPGNVRELKHRIESAALFTEGPIEAAALDLPEGAAALSPVPGPRPGNAVNAADLGTTGANDALERELWTLIEGGYDLNNAIGLCERLLIHAALRAKGNNRTRAAERLGIHVRTIYKKLSP